MGVIFDIVCMNGSPLGFTTALGKDWEMWMACREILCNCLDEQGSHSEVRDVTVEGEVGKTKVYIVGDSFQRAYNARKEFILEDSPEYHGGLIDIHSGSSNYLFYKGVRIAKLNKPSAHTYNLLGNVSLTEDRTLANESWFIQHDLPELILKSGAPIELLDSVIMSGHAETLEYNMRYTYVGDIPEYIRERVREMYRKFPTGVIPVSLATKCAKSLYDTLPDEEDCVLTNVEDMQLTKAKEFLTKLGCSLYNISVKSSLGNNILGLADVKNEIIYISKDVFQLGTKYLAATIFEEFVHIKHDVHDETRAMQDILINYTMSLGEELIGEPI